MNLYIRYFDTETFVHTIDEALDFLASIPEIGLNDEMADDVASYVESSIMYPKRYKVRGRNYFIIIKTLAETMEDFKNKKALNPMGLEPKAPKEGGQPTTRRQLPQDFLEGWYNAQMDFKRVIVQPGTGKCEYVDTHVEYNMKACSGQDCYDRTVEYLKSRCDRRSQYPSIRGRNFQFTYLGKWK